MVLKNCVSSPNPSHALFKQMKISFVVTCEAGEENDLALNQYSNRRNSKSYVFKVGRRVGVTLSIECCGMVN